MDKLLKASPYFKNKKMPPKSETLFGGSSICIYAFFMGRVFRYTCKSCGLFIPLPVPPGYWQSV